jgi:hypothetical protein
MLQRIQTVYLFIAFIAVGVLPFVLPLYVDGNKENFYFVQNLAYVFLFGVSTTLTIVSMLRFKNRKSQFVMNRLNIILNLILLGLFVYQSLNLSGDTDRVRYVSEKGIGMFLPVISIVFLSLANRAIKKDEDLVKSVDRLR